MGIDYRRIVASTTAYVDQEVDVDVYADDLDDDVLIEEMERRGYLVGRQTDSDEIRKLRHALYRGEDLKPHVEALLHGMGYIV